MAMVEATSGSIVNFARYDEFGHVNRIPVSVNLGGAVDSQTASVAFPDSAAVMARVLYEHVDLPSGIYATLDGRGAVYGQTKGHVWSDWVTPSSWPVTLSVTGNCQSCSTQKGALTNSTEYRWYTPGATPMWIPLRLPGQMYDDETDLFENWNQFYDPTAGRYLSPEPMLQKVYKRICAEMRDKPEYSIVFNNCQTFVKRVLAGVWR